MNHRLLWKGTSVLAIVGAAALAGCRHDKVIVVPTQAAAPSQPSTNTIVVREAPPPAREDSTPPGPAPSDKAWAPGHYEYRNNSYTWVEGHWIDKPRAGAEYVAAHWEERDGGWVFVPGTWR